MKIIVFQHEPLSALPPTISLLRGLHLLGHEVIFISKSGNEYYHGFFKENSIKYYEISDKKRLRNGFFPAIVERKKNLGEIISIIEGFTKERYILWTTTENSVAYLGYNLFSFKHVMQLSELLENKIIRSLSNMHSKVKIAEIASKAATMVVPEYNRAHIQKAFWNLGKVPHVLPNTPVEHPKNRQLPITNQEAGEIVKSIKQTKKKIILYQGVINAQRDILPLIECVADMDDYVFCIMGDHDENIKSISGKYSNVYLIPRLPAPSHLEVTSWADIGVMVYEPHTIGERTPLNALFCAPNKIFEFSGFGIPMLVNDCPSLNLSFSKYELGAIVDINDNKSINGGIKRIEREYERMASSCITFYNQNSYLKALSKTLENLSI